MPIYEYKGLNKTGKSVKGMEEAESKSVLTELLKDRGIFVTEILEGSEKGGVGGLKSFDLKVITDRVSLRDIAIVTRQLATLLRAGIPLVQALNALTDQAESEELRRVLSTIKRNVTEGSSLAAAIAEHPKHFNDLYVNMVKAGESSGNLDTVLERLTDFLEAQMNLRSKIIGAMVYPLIMLFVGAAIMVLLFTIVIPKVTKIFQDQGAALPLITRILIWLSYLFSNYWFLILPLIAGIVYGFFYWKKSEKGKPLWDRFVLKVPFFGNLVRMIAVARFSRTLGTLLSSGVPLLGALNIVKDILGNDRLIEVVEEATGNIREGESIAQPLKRSGEFPPLVTHMIAIGETSGQLEEMLDNIAISYNQLVEVRVEALTTILEPLMIVLMGGGAAFVVFAIMLPILQMNQFVG